MSKKLFDFDGMLVGMIIYVVECEDYSKRNKFVDKLFLNKQDADDYCQKMNTGDDCDDYYWGWRKMELE